MQITLLTYLLASLIAYLGLLVGIILIRMAPEEQKPGKKYFIFLKKILFTLILVPMFYFYNLNIIFSLALLCLLAALILGNKLKLDKPYLIYLLLGILFYLSARFIDLFVIEAVLIFLYGVPDASLAFSLKKKNYGEIFIKNLLFFVPAILYIIF